MGSGKPFKGDSAPAQQAIVMQGVPAAEEQIYGDSPIVTDGGYMPAAFKGDSAPAQQAIIVGGAPAVSDAFYADEQVLSDGNKFNVPFFDNAGYVANDQGVIFDSNHKDKGHDHPSRLAVGGKPMAGDSPC